MRAIALHVQIMTINFESAYRQLSPVERVFVDACVFEIEKRAVKTGEKLVDALQVVSTTRDARTLEMLSAALVRAAIAERVRDLTESMELNIYRTLKELRGIAYSSIGHYMKVGDDGQPYFNLGSCTPEQLAAIKSIEIDEPLKGGRKFKITLHDKMSALEKTMRYQGLLESEHQHWKSVSAIEDMKLAAFETIDDAANSYARMIEDD